MMKNAPEITAPMDNALLETIIHNHLNIPRKKYRSPQGRLAEEKMGSECRQSKFHYDIGMSKRTRRQSDFKKAAAECEHKEDQRIEKVGNRAKEKDNKQSIVVVGSSGGFDDEDGDEAQEEEEEEENDNRKSLKQFIQGRSLYQHFSEEEEKEEEKEKEKENQLKLVKQKDIQQGFGSTLKLKKLVSRYGKVLSQLIKIKRNPDAFPKKPIPNKFTTK